MKRLNPDAFNGWVYNIIDDYRPRIEVYYGGAGSGKSVGACQKILLKAMNDKRKVLVIRKVGATLRHSVFQLFLDLLVQSGEYGRSKINRSDFQITLRNGSTLIFKGLDDPEKIKSVTGLTDVVIEEATELTRDDFTQLSLRLRPGREVAFPQIYLMFNPVSKANWVYDYFYVHPPQDCRVVQTTYTDNRFLTPDYIQTLEELKQRNPAYYRIYALGEFATLDKLVFPVITKRLIMPEEVARLPLFVGLDFGYINDPTALVWGRYDRAGRRILLTGEYFKTGLLNDAIARTIVELGLSKEVIVADSAEMKSIDEIRNAGIRRIRRAAKGPDSVRAGLQFMAQHEIVVDERCPRLLEEFENYTWQKDRKTGEYINQPIDAFNHGIDACRYGLEAHRTVMGRVGGGVRL